MKNLSIGDNCQIKIYPIGTIPIYVNVTYNGIIQNKSLRTREVHGFKGKNCIYLCLKDDLCERVKNIN